MPRPPSRPATRTVTVHRSSDLGGITVRRGSDVLGTVGRVGSDTQEWLAGSFTHTPAFNDAADLFRGREKAEATGDTVAVEAIAAQIEALDIHIHHGGHDMRIDDPGTLAIGKGQARFRASPAFQMLRNGGL